MIHAVLVADIVLYMAGLVSSCIHIKETALIGVCLGVQLLLQKQVCRLSILVNLLLLNSRFKTDKACHRVRVDEVQTSQHTLC